MRKSLDVVGIGNAIVDLQLLVSDDDIAALGAKKGEMSLVDHNKQRELLAGLQNKNFSRRSGGSAANTVITIAQLSGRTAYGCLVGDDELGCGYLDEMKELGVRVPVLAKQQAVTGTSLILITPDAERTMLTHLGASADFGPEHVPESEIEQAAWLYIEGYLFSSERGRDAVRRAIDVALKSDTKIALTVSARFIIEVFGEPLREAVSHSSLVFANADEAKCYTGAADEFSALQQLKSEVPGVVITRGGKGVLVHFDGLDEEIQALPVGAVDTTGAGDTLAGGFLYGINRAYSPRDSGRLGCLLAGKVVAQLGPRLAGDVCGFVSGHGFSLR